MADQLSGADFLVPPAVDTLPINFAVLDDTGTILLTNRAWREFGRDNDIAMRPDSVGVNYLAVTAAADDDDARRAFSGLEAVIEGDSDRFELEYPCHAPNEQRWFLMRAVGFEARGSRHVAVAHIDITDRVLSEHESQRFEQAIEAAGHVVFMTEPDGTITYVNPAFERITGFSAGEAIGKTPRILDSGEMPEDFFEGLWETILAGEEWHGTVTNRRKSGSLYDAQMTISPVLDDDDDITEFVAIQTEITDLKQTKQQLQALDDVLRHDLRTALTLIRGHADLIDDADADSAAHTDVIVEATEQLLSTAEKGRHSARSSNERSIRPRSISVHSSTRPSGSNANGSPRRRSRSTLPTG